MEPAGFKPPFLDAAHRFNLLPGVGSFHSCIVPFLVPVRTLVHIGSHWPTPAFRLLAYFVLE